MEGMEARNRPLSEWFNRVRTGQIRLPRFQRFEAWSHSEVSNLLETVLQGLPVGATLMLDVGDKEQFVSRPMIGAPPPTEKATEQLLDGQQRLTALWRALHDNYEERSYFLRFEPDLDHDGKDVPRVFGQARWWNDGKRFPVWAESPSKVLDRGCIPLSLLRPGDVGQELKAWCDKATDGDLSRTLDLVTQIQECRATVSNYNVPFLSLPATTPRDVALDVFIKMNTTSVRLTPFDIIVAQVEEETGKSLHDLVQDLRVRVPNAEAYGPLEDLVLSGAALREDRSPTQASYQMLDLAKLVNEWEQIVAGIAWLVEMLEEERVFDATRLPTVAVLPVLVALNEFIPPNLDARGNALALVRSYVWRAFFTRRYENAAASRALQDFRGVRDAIKGGSSIAAAPIYDEQEFPLPTTEELRAAGWPKSRDILSRAILAVAIKAGALDPADGSPANRANLSKREYHHLFPDTLLVKDAQLSAAQSSRALNCAVITWKTNRNISAKEPLKYLAERVDKSAFGPDEIRTRLACQLVRGHQTPSGRRLTSKWALCVIYSVFSRATLLSHSATSPLDKKPPR